MTQCELWTDYTPFWLSGQENVDFSLLWQSNRTDFYFLKLFHNWINDFLFNRIFWRAAVNGTTAAHFLTGSSILSLVCYWKACSAGKLTESLAWRVLYGISCTTKVFVTKGHAGLDTTGDVEEAWGFALFIYKSKSWKIIFRCHYYNYSPFLLVSLLICRMVCIRVR